MDSVNLTGEPLTDISSHATPTPNSLATAPPTNNGSEAQVTTKPLKSTKKPSLAYLASLVLNSEDPDNTIIRNPLCRPGSVKLRALRKMPRVPPSKKISPSATDQPTLPELGPEARASCRRTKQVLPVPEYPQLQMKSDYEEFWKPIRAKQDAIGEEMVTHWKGIYEEHRETFGFRSDRHRTYRADKKAESPEAESPPRRITPRRTQVLYDSDDSDAFQGFRGRRRNQQKPPEEPKVALVKYPQLQMKSDYEEFRKPLRAKQVAIGEEMVTHRKGIYQKHQETYSGRYNRHRSNHADKKAESPEAKSPPRRITPRRTQVLCDSDDSDAFQGFRSRRRNQQKPSDEPKVVSVVDSSALDSGYEQDSEREEDAKSEEKAKKTSVEIVAKEENDQDTKLVRFLFSPFSDMSTDTEHSQESTLTFDSVQFTFHQPRVISQDSAIDQNNRRETPDDCHLSDDCNGPLCHKEHAPNKPFAFNQNPTFREIFDKENWSFYPRLSRNRSRPTQRGRTRSVHGIGLEYWRSGDEPKSNTVKNVEDIFHRLSFPAPQFGEGDQTIPAEPVEEPPEQSSVEEDELEQPPVECATEAEVEGDYDDQRPSILLHRSTSGGEEANEEHDSHESISSISIPPPSTPRRPLSRLNLLSQSLSPLDTGFRLINWVSNVSLPSSAPGSPVGETPFEVPISPCSPSMEETMAPAHSLPLVEDDEGLDAPDRHPLSATDDSDSSSCGELWRFIWHLSDDSGPEA
ncbi:hypothetical protein FB446DRAFT_845492 [Lentinula raphanica]|nr:hypothetical protein FB446DRAFT_845492 [Lentinula raphanica]